MEFEIFRWLIIGMLSGFAIGFVLGHYSELFHLLRNGLLNEEKLKEKSFSSAEETDTKESKEKENGK